MRYERKFVVSPELVFRVEQDVKIHPLFFSEIYEERVVNNLYLDTEGLELYHMHVDGASDRVKARVRWYGNEKELVKPVLEIKGKVGDVGYKKLFALPRADVSDLFCVSVLRKLFCDSNLVIAGGLDVASLRLVLYNSYRRSYWLSSDARFRLTIDHDIVSQNIMSGGCSDVYSHANAVVELKYDKKYNEEAVVIGQYFPWRPTRHSKYILGLEEFLSRV